MLIFLGDFSKRFVLGVTALFVGVGLVLGVVLVGPSFLTSLGGAGNKGSSGIVQTTGSSKGTLGDNAIVQENAQMGTTTWKIAPGKAATTQIQAYANARSVLPGNNLVFFVSTKQDATNYWLDIYRLGWYGGLGGRLMTSIGTLTGHAQGYYDVISHHLVGCNTCLVNSASGLVEANWQPSYTLLVPLNWTTGVYLAKFTDSNGMQTYVPFDVRGNASSTYVVVTPDTTYAAYNDWGGYSLYDADNTFFGEADTATTATQKRAVKVSFDRPYTNESGSSQVLVFEANAIRWMERQGYNLSYMSNIDVQREPAQLLHHKAYISIGHDEYWTKEMRDAVTTARDSGVGLAFLGANAVYWQIRMEPNSAGIPNRTIVCYKVSSVKHDLARDPYYLKDTTRLTTQWRDPILALPENALVGIMFSDLNHKVNGFPWHVDAAAASPLLNGTQLALDQSYGCSLVGYEWDRVFTNGATPKSLHILATSFTQNDAGVKDQSNTTYYVAPSGAMVFASGSIYWAHALDSYRYQVDKNCLGHDTAIPGAQKLMAAVMDALVVRQVVQ